MLRPYCLTVKDPKIVINLINDVEYSINEFPMDITVVRFTNDLGITGDPKLDIVYSLQKDDGNPYNPSVISNFDGVNLKFTVSSSDPTLPIVNNFKLVAWFAFKPSIVYESPFKVFAYNCLIDPPPSLIADIIYEAGSGPFTQAIAPWTQTYPAS